MTLCRWTADCWPSEIGGIFRRFGGRQSSPREAIPEARRHGRGVDSVALWVSAIEILAYAAGGAQRASHSNVHALLASFKWSPSGKGPWSALDSRRYVVHLKKNVLVRSTAAQHAYERMYAARNAYFRGDPVTGSLLRPWGRKCRPSRRSRRSSAEPSSQRTFNVNTRSTPHRTILTGSWTTSTRTPTGKPSQRSMACGSAGPAISTSSHGRSSYRALRPLADVQSGDPTSAGGPGALVNTRTAQVIGDREPPSSPALCACVVPRPVRSFGYRTKSEGGTG